MTNSNIEVYARQKENSVNVKVELDKDKVKVGDTKTIALKDGYELVVTIRNKK